MTFTSYIRKLLFFILLGSYPALVHAQGYAEGIRLHRQEYFEKLKDRVDFGPGDQVSKYLNYYDPDSVFRITATFRAAGKTKPITFPTSAGKKVTYLVFGEFHFTVSGQACVLEVYRPSVASPLTRGLLFIPFRDLTSGTDTYGGGRYLDLKMEEVVNGKVILDFNKAYNPLCAYEDGFSCPIPPKKNHLKVRIEAGEKAYR